MKYITLIPLAILISGCVTTGRYSQHNDSAPSRPPTQLEMQDAEVTNEPIGRGTNPYTIRGITYKPDTKRKPFREHGVASWYGKKFHGHLTSNGEIYDMYGMTAAHKTLPLPSFVKVTNVANGKTAIVRVNDRGPFHDNRIIDLSYSAAHKIGVYDTGTAKVEIEVLLPDQQDRRYQVKLAGFNSLSDAKDSAKGLSLLMHEKAKTKQHRGSYILQFGPYDNKNEAHSILQKVKKFGFNNAEVLPLYAE